MRHVLRINHNRLPHKLSSPARPGQKTSHPHHGLAHHCVGRNQHGVGIRSGHRVSEKLLSRPIVAYERKNMPIHPSMKELYPKNWPAISKRIRFERAGNRCEACGAENYQPHPETGSRVVLTIAHLDHNPAKQRRRQPGRALPEVSQHLRRAQAPCQPQALPAAF